MMMMMMMGLEAFKLTLKNLCKGKSQLGVFISLEHDIVIDLLLESWICILTVPSP